MSEDKRKGRESTHFPARLAAAIILGTTLYFPLKRGAITQKEMESQFPKMQAVIRESTANTGFGIFASHFEMMPATNQFGIPPGLVLIAKMNREEDLRGITPFIRERINSGFAKSGLKCRLGKPVVFDLPSRPGRNYFPLLGRRSLSLLDGITKAANDRKKVDNFLDFANQRGKYAPKPRVRTKRTPVSGAIRRPVARSALRANRRR